MTNLTFADLRATPGQRTRGYVHVSVTDVEVHLPVYLINGAVDGPTLLVKGVGDALTTKDGGAPLARFISQAQDLGVRLLVCQPSLDLNDLAMEDMIDGVEMIGGAAFNDMAVEADAVISF